MQESVFDRKEMGGMKWKELERVTRGPWRTTEWEQSTWGI